MHDDSFEIYYIMRHFGMSVKDLYNLQFAFKEAQKKEFEEKKMSKEEWKQYLEIHIDEALDNGNKQLFLKLSEEYNKLRSC